MNVYLFPDRLNPLVHCINGMFFNQVLFYNENLHYLLSNKKVKMIVKSTYISFIHIYITYLILPLLKDPYCKKKVIIIG